MGLSDRSVPLVLPVLPALRAPQVRPDLSGLLGPLGLWGLPVQPALLAPRVRPVLSDLLGPPDLWGLPEPSPRRRQ